MIRQMWNSCFFNCTSCKLALFLTMIFFCSFFLVCNENRWVLLQERVGHLEKPFRISLEYIASGNRSVAVIDSFAMKNCSTGKDSVFLPTLILMYSTYKVVGTVAHIHIYALFCKNSAYGNVLGNIFFPFSAFILISNPLVSALIERRCCFGH